jgi:hypothetical protein
MRHLYLFENFTNSPYKIIKGKIEYMLDYQNLKLDDIEYDNIFKENDPLFDMFLESFAEEDYNRETFYKYFTEYKSTLFQHINNDKIKIYREIYVDNNWFKKLESGDVNSFGEYYSHNKKIAKSWDFYSQNKEMFPITIECEVFDIDIKWMSSIILHML